MAGEKQLARLEAALDGDVVVLAGSGWLLRRRDVT
jgi:hypothetical protein